MRIKDSECRKFTRNEPDFYACKLHDFVSMRITKESCFFISQSLVLSLCYLEVILKLEILIKSHNLCT